MEVHAAQQQFLKKLGIDLPETVQETNELTQVTIKQQSKKKLKMTPTPSEVDDNECLVDAEITEINVVAEEENVNGTQTSTEAKKRKRQPEPIPSTSAQSSKRLKSARQKSFTPSLKCDESDDEVVSIDSDNNSVNMERDDDDDGYKFELDIDELTINVSNAKNVRPLWKKIYVNNIPFLTVDRLVSLYKKFVLQQSYVSSKMVPSHSLFKDTAARFRAFRLQKDHSLNALKTLSQMCQNMVDSYTMLSRRQEEKVSIDLETFWTSYMKSAVGSLLSLLNTSTRKGLQPKLTLLSDQEMENSLSCSQASSDEEEQPVRHRQLMNQMMSKHVTKKRTGTLFIGANGNITNAAASQTWWEQNTSDTLSQIPLPAAHMLPPLCGISRKRGEQFSSLKGCRCSGEVYMELKLYRTKDIVGVPYTERYKKALFNCKVIGDHGNPMIRQAQKIIDNLQGHIMEEGGQERTYQSR